MVTEYFNFAALEFKCLNVNLIQANLEDDTTRPSFQDYAETLKVSIVVCEISSMN